MSAHRGGKGSSKGGSSKGGDKGDGLSLADFEALFLPIYGPDNIDSAKEKYRACGGDKDKIALLVSNLIEDQPQAVDDWHEARPKAKVEKPKESNVSASAPGAAKSGGEARAPRSSNNDNKFSNSIGGRSDRGAAPAGGGAPRSTDRSRPSDNRVRKGSGSDAVGVTTSINSEKPFAASAPVANVDAVVAVEKKESKSSSAPALQSSAAAPSKAATTKSSGKAPEPQKPSFRDAMLRKERQEAEAKAAAIAAEAEAKRKQEADDAAAIAKKKKDEQAPKEERPRKPKPAKAETKPSESLSTSETTVALNAVVAASVESPAPQSESAPVAKKETSIPQLEQSFNGISTSDSVLSTIASEPTSTIPTSQAQAQINFPNENDFVSKPKPALQFGTVSASNISSSGNFVAPGGNFGFSGSAFHNSQSSEAPGVGVFPSAEEPLISGKPTLDAFASNKPPGLGHKEASHVQGGQVRSNNIQAQVPQMQSGYNQQTYNMGMPAPGYNMMQLPYNGASPYAPAPQAAPTGGLSNSMTGVNTQTPIASAPQPMFGQQGNALQTPQGQQPTQQQQQQQMAYMYPPPYYNPYAYPQGYPPNHFMPQNHPYHPRFPPRQGPAGTYDNQYPGFDAYAGYGGVDPSSAMSQPQQPAKQGKGNAGGQVNSNAQAQVDHSGQYTNYQAARPEYPYQQNMYGMGYPPANQPPGMPNLGMNNNNNNNNNTNRNNNGGGGAMSNQHQNFQQNYPTGAQRNNQQIPQYNNGNF